MLHDNTKYFAGGHAIQQECTEKVRRHGSLNEGEVILTTAGKLRCQKIAHAVGPTWKGGHNQEAEYLEDCIIKSLEMTDQNNFTSIVIPALCTGIFGYPIADAHSSDSQVSKEISEEES